MLTKILRWAGTHTYFMYFNPNDNQGKFGGFEHQLVVANVTAVKTNENSFDLLQETIHKKKQHLFGLLSYELKNEFFPLPGKIKTIESPHALFFVPEVHIKFMGNSIRIESNDPAQTWESILDFREEKTQKDHYNIDLKCRTSKDLYIRNCQKIKDDIKNGEYYEMNYCIEHHAQNCTIDPIAKYLQLNETSPMPFSCLAKFDHVFTLCASPERFIKKENDRLLSQPIKGTIRRGKDELEDQQLKAILRTSQKEIAENMMIVDLVRNDLNRSSETGTVKVEEFFGIYTFKQVHQMISTISSKVRNQIPITEIIKNAFPMGSMTGAPKIRVMQAINDYEDSQRGIYSGALGYITPDGDFDFNVVIRSIIYDAQAKKLSFHVGSAITYDADPEYEFEECLLKAKSMIEILSKE